MGIIHEPKLIQKDEYEYLKVRGRPHEGEPIFIRSVSGGKGNDDPALEGRSYRKNFKTLCRRVGLPAQGYFPHQVRDVLRTEWQRTGADPLVCEFIMGHGVDPNKYLQFMKAPDYVLEQYRVAESRLNLVSNPDPSMVNRNEMEDLRREVARLQAEKTEAEAITARLEQKYDELIKRIEKLEKPS